MENQHTSVFRQKNKRGLTVLCIVLCVLLSPALGISLFVPQALALIPLVIMAMLGYVGPVSACACGAVLVSLAFLLFGLWGAVAAALVFVPVVVVTAMTIERDQPFWQSVAASAVTMFASLFAVVAMLTLLTGSDIVTALTGFITKGIETSGSLGDTMLSMMAQLGMIKPSADVQIGANGVLTLEPAVKEELIANILMMMDSMMRLEIPMQMATAAVSGGLLGQAVMRKGVIRRGQKTEYHPLRTWHVPRGWGRILGGTLILLYVLAQLVPQSMNTMFYVFSGVFDQVFSLQGAAMMCYILHRKGKGPVWQGAAFILGYFALGSIGVMLGIADQTLDFAHRREELDKMDNPFDPRRGEL